MTTEKRIKNIKPRGPKTARFSYDIGGYRSPSETDVVRYLAILDSGLEKPSALNVVKR